MAKKKAIMQKALCCFVVIAILMSVMPVFIPEIKAELTPTAGSNSRSTDGNSWYGYKEKCLDAKDIDECVIPETTYEKPMSLAAKEVCTLTVSSI